MLDKHFIYDILIDKGLSTSVAVYLNMVVLLLILVTIAFIVDFLSTRFLWRFSHSVAKRTKTNFDNILITNKLPRNVAHILPLLILIEFAPQVFSDFEYIETILRKALKIAGIILTIRIIKSVLMSLRTYLKTRPKYKDKPIYSYIQVVMIFIWLLAVFSIFAIITKISFLEFITSLGAVSAIIILIFRDTILGFVASIQVTVNDMVRIGDWITFDKYGADGDVTEITLAAVKVQNWDKTITTIPTYALISESFRNWRGMTASGGRRIKRSVIIKASSIKFLTVSDIERLKAITLIKDYLSQRETLINKHNLETKADKSVLINGRNFTNFGVFRTYLQNYIEQHPAVHKDMTLMVRQLEQTAQGVPVEIYAFSKDQLWVNYEAIVGDIFDHVLASVSFFDLEVFEFNIPNQG